MSIITALLGDNNICPACGVDWAVLTDSLTEQPGDDGLESENHALARMIIWNCATCQAHFKELKR